jgi:[protein-PII] uridylyltransferase
MKTGKETYPRRTSTLHPMAYTSKIGNMESVEGDIDTLEDIERFFQKGREWLKKRHEQGIPGGEFCLSHSILMDTVIRRLFKRAVDGQGLQASSLEFSLVAVGGYGREELSPFSDIDLLLLHLPTKGKDLEEWVRTVLHPLWDWGLTVGYTVQTPKESLRAAQKDFDLFFPFLDARWVAGDKEAFFRWQDSFSGLLATGKDAAVVSQIRQRFEARHKHYGGSVFVLEPDVKEGKGGLRDYHSAYWAAKVKYRVQTAAQLTEHALLSEKEWQSYSRALEFLWRVRNQLHYLHGRKEDRLSFEDQEALAVSLGYPVENSLLATEAFLKEYFTHALHVYQLSWNLLEKCLNEQAAFPENWGREDPIEITPGFFLHHGKLSMVDPRRFDRNPLHLWGAFEAVHRHGVDTEARLKEKITENLDSVGERFRCAEESIRPFLSFFEQPGYLYRVLEIMLETGFLRKFLPEFDRIYCQVQYDRYHVFPVDIHSLYAVRELENLDRNKDTDLWPLFSELMKEIKDPGLLKLAALIHDLGKAEGSSHAQRGEKIAAEIGERLHLARARIENLRFLVREHLTFAEIAQRRDLNDENLIFRFAQTVGDGERLRMLYLLSFADIRAVGPSSWTNWKDTLMRELFLKALHLLEKGEGLGREEQDRLIKIQREVMELLAGQVLPPKVAEYLVNIPPRHYAVHEGWAIAQQILMAEKLIDQRVVWEGEEKPEEGYEEVTVVVRDEPGLFSKISGVMTANFLTILSAQISTWENGIAVDRFRVHNLIDEGLFQTSRWKKIQEDLKNVLEGNVQVSSLVAAMVLPLFQGYPSSWQATKVEVDNTASDFYTIVEIYTHDRPGLLCRVSQIFFELGLNIWSARIATKVDQVVDVFYIQDLSGAKLTDEEVILKLKQELVEELEKW